VADVLCRVEKSLNTAPVAGIERISHAALARMGTRVHGLSRN